MIILPIWYVRSSDIYIYIHNIHKEINYSHFTSLYFTDVMDELYREDILKQYKTPVYKTTGSDG